MPATATKPVSDEDLIRDEANRQQQRRDAAERMFWRRVKAASELDYFYVEPGADAELDQAVTVLRACGVADLDYGRFKQEADAWRECRITLAALTRMKAQAEPLPAALTAEKAKAEAKIRGWVAAIFERLEADPLFRVAYGLGGLWDLLPPAAYREFYGNPHAGIENVYGNWGKMNLELTNLTTAIGQHEEKIRQLRATHEHLADVTID